MMRFHLLCLSAWTLLASVTCATEFQSGFETGTVLSPDGWKFADEGMSKVSTMNPRSGKRALTIVDDDGTDGGRGSSVWSDFIRVRRGQEVRLTAWCYFSSGDARGLGIYIEFVEPATQPF